MEQKNLKRQNFYAFDVNKNKAQCLAERYSALCGMDIDFSTKTIEETWKVNSSSHDHNVIFFDCTDNKKARESIEQIAQKSNSVIISCGNEDTFGQVLVSRTGNSYWHDACKFLGFLNNIIEGVQKHDQDYAGNKHVIHILPTLLTLFPEFKDTETLSCTDMALQVEQSMPINMLVAQLAYNVFYQILGGLPFKYHMVRCNVDNTYSTDFINNPIVARSLFMKLICLEDSDKAALSFNILYKALIEDVYSYYRKTEEEIIKFVEPHGKYARGCLRAIMEFRSQRGINSSVLLNYVKQLEGKE